MGGAPRTTIDGLETPAGSRAAAWSRRLFLAALCLVLFAGLSGVLGVRTGTATAGSAGYTLTVSYPQVARAGLDTRWRVRVHHPGGFGKSLVLAVTGSYFDVFESQGFAPEPASATRNGRTLVLTFDAPEADTFVVDYDAYVQPASQVGRRSTVALLDGGRPVVSVPIRTWLVP